MKTMTYSGTSKSRNRNGRPQSKNKTKNRRYYDEDDDDDDDDDVVRISNNKRQQPVKKKVDNNKFEVIGEVVNIKSNRKEIYHDGEGYRTYGSWK